MIEYQIDGYFEFHFNTQNPATGAQVDADATPTYRVYESNNDTVIDSGDCAKRDDANTTGYYLARGQCTTALGYEVGKDYYVRVAAIVGGVTGAAPISNPFFRIVPADVTRDDLWTDARAGYLTAAVATAGAVGTPVAVDGGTASVAGMLLKVIDDSGTGATFDATTDSLNAIRDTAPIGTAMRGTDSAALATGVAVTSIANDVITAASINTGAFTADAFAANAIVAATLNADCITNAKIADNAIGPENLAADTIGASELAAGAAAEIAAAESDRRKKIQSALPTAYP